jgi:hypothetical protein
MLVAEDADDGQIAEGVDMRMRSCVVASLFTAALGLALGSPATAGVLRPGDILVSTVESYTYDLELPYPDALTYYPSEGILKLDAVTGEESVAIANDLEMFRETPGRVLFDPSGDLIVQGRDGYVRVDRVTGEASLAVPYDGRHSAFAFDPNGNLVVAGFHDAVRIDLETGDVTTVLPRDAAITGEPRALIVDRDGTLYAAVRSLVGERGFKILVVDTTGNVTVLSERGLIESSPRRLLFDADGSLVAVMGAGIGGGSQTHPARLVRIDPRTGAQTLVHEFTHGIYDAVRAPSGAFVISRVWQISLLDPATGDETILAERPPDASPYLLDLAVVPPAEPSDVEIDIRPWSFINLSSRRPIRVAIRGSARVDATRIEPNTLAFGPAGAAPLAGRGWLRKNRSGFLDLWLSFPRAQSGLAQGDTEVCLDGVLDQPFRACLPVGVFETRRPRWRRLGR